MLEFCTEYDADFEELLEEGSVLNEYITEGRYPGDIAFEIIGDTEAQEAVGITCCIRDMVVARLPIDND